MTVWSLIYIGCNRIYQSICCKWKPHVSDFREWLIVRRDLQLSAVQPNYVVFQSINYIIFSYITYVAILFMSWKICSSILKKYYWKIILKNRYNFRIFEISNITKILNEQSVTFMLTNILRYILFRTFFENSWEEVPESVFLNKNR